MFIIILLYDLCWAPIKLYQFLLYNDFISYCSETQFYTLIALYIGCHWLAMANSFVNPIVYSFMSKSFLVKFGFPQNMNDKIQLIAFFLQIFPRLIFAKFPNLSSNADLTTTVINHFLNFIFSLVFGFSLEM